MASRALTSATSSFEDCAPLVRLSAVFRGQRSGCPAAEVVLSGPPTLPKLVSLAVRRMAYGMGSE